jgi:hypothetical protein
LFDGVKIVVAASAQNAQTLITSKKVSAFSYIGFFPLFKTCISFLSIYDLTTNFTSVLKILQ